MVAIWFLVRTAIARDLHASVVVASYMYIILTESSDTLHKTAWLLKRCEINHMAVGASQAMA